MNRRKFIRMIAGVPVVFASVPLYANVTSLAGQLKKRNPSAVLLETCQFDIKGGWVLDTAFYQQTGSNYLLAHGMGKPVDNARTTAVFPKTGKYNVWVRTKDWCPGKWDAPGRFKLLVDGKALKTTFGTDAGWNWQFGGTVDIERTKVSVELEDLTGFDGRCDSIYFTPAKDDIPPNETAELVEWKDIQSGRTDLDIQTEKFDLVVIGGGIAGCAAAIAADSQGLKVALVQDRPVFGGNASKEVRVHTIGISGKSENIISRIDTGHWPNGSADAIKDNQKRQASIDATGIHQFANFQACGVELSDKRIVSIEARNTTTGIIKRFKAKRFVDATGHGWIAFFAGAKYRYGREASSEFNEWYDKHGELWSPTKADNRIMGSSVLFNSETTNEQSSFPDVPWAKPVAKSHKAINGEWYWEYSDNDLNQIDDAEQIRDHLLRAIYGSFANSKKNPKNTNVALKWVAFNSGPRESRRFIGDHIYNFQDAASNKYFHDTVVEEVRDLDTHYQRKETGDKLDFLSRAIYYNAGKYYIPFRSLYAKDVDNLMLAGRCFSCTHIGLAGPRVQKTTGQMGVATGYAATLCKKYNATPRTVRQKHIKELRKLIGYE